jgi:PAS domain S-box-containing protein
LERRINFHKNKIVSILRKQADKILDGKVVGQEENLTNEEISILLNELEIFELELEMQNDEIKISYDALDNERAKFVGLFDLAPVGYFILDYLGVIEDINQTGVNLLDTSRDVILSKRFQSFLSPDSYEIFFGFLHKLQNKDGRQTMEVKLVLPDKTYKYTRIEGIAISHLISKNIKYYITVIDITESRYARKVLQETKERLEMTLQASSTGIWTANLKNETVYLDDFSYDILGIKPWEFDGSIQSFLKLIYARDQEQIKQLLINSVNNSTEVDIDFKIQTRDGTFKYISIKGHGVTDNDDNKYFAGILLNITERRKLALEAESLKNNQQRLLLAATLNAQENERENISRALHDSVCQILYGIKLNIQNIQINNNLKGTFKNINQLLDQAIRETRQISYELTPSVLKDFGFIAGIKEMAQRTSTPQFHILTHITNVADNLPGNLQLYLFRIIQELVNNCIKHSNANVVEIKVTIENEFVIVIVSDNGTGFVVDIDKAYKTGSGLRGIKNRLFLLDGIIEFDSSEKGTVVEIRFKELTDLSKLDGL